MMGTLEEADQDEQLRHIAFEFIPLLVKVRVRVCGGLLRSNIKGFNGELYYDSLLLVFR